MPKEDTRRAQGKGRENESQSDTQGNDEPIDMEGQEETEISRNVNDEDMLPDETNEEVDEKID
jgi:hypothetical protein